MRALGPEAAAAAAAYNPSVASPRAASGLQAAASFEESSHTLSEDGSTPEGIQRMLLVSDGDDLSDMLCMMCGRHACLKLAHVFLKLRPVSDVHAGMSPVCHDDTFPTPF